MRAHGPVVGLAPDRHQEPPDEPRVDAAAQLGGPGGAAESDGEGSGLRLGRRHGKGGLGGDDAARVVRDVRVGHDDLREEGDAIARGEKLDEPPQEYRRPGPLREGDEQAAPRLRAQPRVQEGLRNSA